VKKAARNWLIGCGGCALLAVLAFVGLALALKSPIEGWINDGKDPEKAWVVVQKLLPYEQRPALAEVKFGRPIGWVGITLAVLNDKRNGAKIDLLAMSREQTSSFDKLFDAQESGHGEFANMSPLLDPVAGKLDVQGRSGRTRFGRGTSKRDQSGGEVVEEVSKLRVDLTDATGDHVCLQYELGRGSAAELEAAATEFLSEFTLWRAP
jgi:hypothetical protein